MGTDDDMPARRPATTGAIERAPALADTLAARLRADIADGQLRSGEKLPSEQQISENYGVSRPTVREAIGRLKQDGLVVSRQGAGVFVADPNAGAVFRLNIGDFSDKEEIHHLIELLMAIESSATEHAAMRRDEASLARIRTRLDAMQQAIERGESGVDEDVAFHREIIEATGNPFFCDLSNFLDRKVRSFIRTARGNSARHAGLTQMVQQEHIAIYQAIQLGNPALARKAAETHLKNAERRLAVYLLGRNER